MEIDPAIKCDLCSKKFATKANKTRHVKSAHSGAQRLQIPCNTNNFVTRTQLESCWQPCQANQLQFTLNNESCPVVLTSKTYLKKHWQEYHLGKPSKKQIIFSDFVWKREGGSRTKPISLYKDNLGSNFKGRGG